MCGIAGIFHRNGRPVDPSLLRRLTGMIVHRGPDEEGYFLDGGYGCGSRRLSIIDLRRGRQPIVRRGGELALVYNGELYNYRELRRELADLGHAFSTDSDSEVVLASWEQWEEKCLDRFNGMFAIAIYDTRKKELFLARDRLGIKPLYYRAEGDLFVFGSEMKVLLGHPAEKRRLDVRTLSTYLTYGYYSSGGPTPVRGIRLLEAGHWLRVSRKRLQGPQSYWEISPEVIDTYRTREEAAEAVYDLLVDSVRVRLAGDVPICVMLSSGLDSSTLAYILNRELDAPMKAFTVGLESPRFDESSDAGSLANNFGMEWESELIHPADLIRDFDDLIAHTDSLQGNSAQIIYYFCNKLIHDRGFKVALNGSGGDELFFGYPTYQADTFFRYWRRVPGSLRRLLHSCASRLPAGTGRVTFDYKVKKFTEYPGADPYLAHAYWRTLFTGKNLARLIRPEWHGQLARWEDLYGSWFDRPSTMPFINRVQVADLYCWLIPLLSWVDNMSMAHSVELRVPFLDHRLVEEVVRLPPSYKFGGWALKKFMKIFLRKRLPAETRRIPKRGTHVPLGEWLNGELGPLKEEYLSSGRLERLGLFEETYLRKLVNEHKDKVEDHTFQLWNLIVFSAWADTFRVTL